MSYGNIFKILSWCAVSILLIKCIWWAKGSNELVVFVLWCAAYWFPNDLQHADVTRIIGTLSTSSEAPSEKNLSHHTRQQLTPTLHSRVVWSGGPSTGWLKTLNFCWNIKILFPIFGGISPEIVWIAMNINRNMNNNAFFLMLFKRLNIIRLGITTHVCRASRQITPENCP